MSSILRKIKREEEKKELERLKKTYSKKPRDKCPKCGRKSLFITVDSGIYCVRCDKKIKDKK